MTHDRRVPGLPAIVLAGALGALFGPLAACGRPAADPSQPADDATSGSGDQPDRPARRFAYPALDGSVASSAALAGRMTLVVLGSESDPASTAQARFVIDLFHGHSPRVNALLLLLDPAENLPLVRAFADFLAAPFPVALADADTIAGAGPFPGLHHVPSVLLLDRQGREVWRHVGLAERAELERALERHE
ncbi:MAG: TlpA family protein disulfide reductase [Polyangiaceae bacterium]|nr:TlpA family protein disulfide reductase [Polyangiaceae bacterium]